MKVPSLKLSNLTAFFAITAFILSPTTYSSEAKGPCKLLEVGDKMKNGDIEVELKFFREPGEEVNPDRGTITVRDAKTKKEKCSTTFSPGGQLPVITSDFRYIIFYSDQGFSGIELNVYSTSNCGPTLNFSTSDMNLENTPTRVQIYRKPFCGGDAYCGDDSPKCTCYAAKFYTLNAKCEFEYQKAQSDAATKAAFGIAFPEDKIFPGKSDAVKKNPHRSSS